MKPDRITTRRTERPAIDDDPRVQLIAAAIDSRLAAVLSTVEALTEAIHTLDRIDDQRGEQIAGLYAITKAQGETLALLAAHSVKV